MIDYFIKFSSSQIFVQLWVLPERQQEIDFVLHDARSVILFEDTGLNGSCVNMMDGGRGRGGGRER